MTTITDKITEALQTLQCFDDPSEFGELSTLIRNDLLGFSLQRIRAYLILHIAKVKANEEEFDIIYEQSQLKPQFKKAFFDAVFPHVNEIRSILQEENERNIKHFKDLDWKLSLVTGCRARQKILLPKYTLKLDIQEGCSLASTQEGANSIEDTESFVMDSDYTNLKRIQEALEDALKSIDTTYSKKVFKFLK